MAKEQADFYIEKVRYTKDRTRITWVSIREDSGKKLGVPYNMQRRRLVSLIRAGKRFMTIFRNPEGKYRRGKRLIMAQVNGQEVICTDPGGAGQDRLEDIPEY
ncbi:MAG: hypothetical protein VB089_16180 [Anaerolineaceae bacterium]|jgi:hypothetical protein|nr:hypothetical protein [Anaerolineaceae bacterium]